MGSNVVDGSTNGRLGVASDQVPAEADLVAFVDRPRRPSEVARHFGCDARPVYHVLRRLCASGILEHVAHGVFAPPGCSDRSVPLPSLQARLVAALHQPRTAAEATRMAGLARPADGLLERMVRLQLVIPLRGGRFISPARLPSGHRGYRARAHDGAGAETPDPERPGHEDLVAALPVPLGVPLLSRRLGLENRTARAAEQHGRRRRVGLGGA